MGEATLYASGSRRDFFNLTIQPIGAIWLLSVLLWSTVFVTFAVKFVNSVKSRYPDAVLMGVSILLFTLGFFSVK